MVTMRVRGGGKGVKGGYQLFKVATWASGVLLTGIHIYLPEKIGSPSFIHSANIYGVPIMGLAFTDATVNIPEKVSAVLEFTSSW